MSHEFELVISPLCQDVSVDGETIKVEIYRGVEDKDWVLEVVDKYGNSTVWDDLFDTDNAAFKEALKTIEDEGIHSLIGSTSQPHKEYAIDSTLQALDGILCSDIAPENAMNASSLEGFFTALVIGPSLVSPSQYTPWIWDMDEGKDEVIYNSMEQMQETMGLFMAVWNHVAESFSSDPSSFEPAYFRAVEWGATEWCEGFLMGTQLFDDSWALLWMKEPKLVTPFLRLGDELGIAMTRKEKNQEKWIHAVPESLVAIHAHWLEHRINPATEMPEIPARRGKKVGRNDPCPCGSDKKYKKCCGAPTTIH